MRNYMHLWAGLAALSIASAAAAQQPIVYPARGQSPQQQAKDDGDCYVWSKHTTGVDPAVLAQTPPPQSPPPSSSTAGGQRAKGAMIGAAGGAVIGEIADDDAGKGAAIGAVVGTMAGGRAARQKQQQQAQAQQQQKQQQEQQKQQQMNTFYRAYGACMEGRGYTIK